MAVYHRPRVVYAHEKYNSSSLVENQALSATNHISNNTSHSLSFKNAGSTFVDADSTKTEDEFVDESLRSLADNGELLDGDHVIISHGYWDYGYGGGEQHIDHNGFEDLHGVCVYDGITVNPRESKAFVWHELGHIMGCVHKDGCYEVLYDSEHGDYRNSNITPMATGYVHGPNGHEDTQYSTSGWHGFSEFHCGMPEPSNYENDKDDFDDHHVYPYSDEAINEIENTID